jgi:hypothetical protein
MFESLTEKYHIFGQILLRNSHINSWDSLVIACPIRSNYCTAIELYATKGDEKIYFPNVEFNDVFLAEEVAVYIRDHMLNLTGDRIWGLTFTLYPTGKFEIDYDYNKPEDYDDSDETITGEEINQSLFDLGFRAVPTDKDPKGNE